MKAAKRIQILLTGGTLDKDYNRLTGNVEFPKKTHFSALARRVNLCGDYLLTTLFLKDSLEISEAEREAIVKACLDSPAKRIIIIHGTDTMVATANVLKVTLERIGNEKTVILTGAMRPWALGDSDAEFNLGMAYALVQTLESGVYITMQGQYWPAGQVVKNRQVGLFSTI